MEYYRGDSIDCYWHRRVYPEGGDAQIYVTMLCASTVFSTHPLRATSAIRHLSRIDDACGPIRQWALIPRRAPRAACNNMTGATCGVWPRRAPRDGRPAAQKQPSMCVVCAFGLSGASWNPLEGF